MTLGIGTRFNFRANTSAIKIKSINGNGSGGKTELLLRNNKLFQVNYFCGNEKSIAKKHIPPLYDRYSDFLIVIQYFLLHQGKQHWHSMDVAPPPVGCHRTSTMSESELIAGLRHSRKTLKRLFSQTRFQANNEDCFLFRSIL